MMRRMNKWLRRFLYFLLGIFIIFCGLFIYLYIVAIDIPPVPNDSSSLTYKVEEPQPGLLVIGKNWMRKNRYGLWEMYIEGEPFERGVINGKLSKDLIVEQEVAFSEQID